MQFDYGTLLNPNPILMTVGTIRKPTLNEISALTFDKFSVYEAFLKITPEQFYTKFKEGGKEYWKSLSDKQREAMTMYRVILCDQDIQKLYVEILSFFFVEPIIFKEGLFVILKQSAKKDDEITADDIRGVIHEKIFQQVLDALQQICCIYEKEPDIEGIKFKNKTARKIYEKMLKAQKKNRENKKADINMSLPNIISAVSNSHPSINILNVWDMTIFQLLDSFNRLQVNSMFKIDCTRVSVWGDEKKTFNAALWYKNYFDSK